MRSADSSMGLGHLKMTACGNLPKRKASRFSFVLFLGCGFFVSGLILARSFFLRERRKSMDLMA